MKKANITIEYCPKCGWLLRAAWMAQELLTSFTEEIETLKLKPATVAGVFRIYVGETLLFDRKTDGGFPEIKNLKQQVRDRIAPDKDLGHSDRKA
ncbi:SelT/SelW/SelH family protein [Niabella terrae]